MDQEPGYVLHSYPYKESSLIVEVFTRRHGRAGLLARGARRPRSAIRGMLLAFHPLGLSWSGSGELGTLRTVDWAGTHRAPVGRGLMCGFYLNELLLRLVPRDDPHERLFDAYAAEVQRVDANGDGVISAAEGDVDEGSDGFDDNSRLFLPATQFLRFAVTREINDGYLAPRFAPSQRAWLVQGAQVRVSPAAPASVSRDGDDR